MTSEFIDRQPWEKQEGESMKAYTAFCTYRDLGSARSLIKAERATKGLQTSNVSGRWRQWSTDHEWKKRAQDYDLHLELIARVQREAVHHKELEDYRGRQKQLATATTASSLKLLRLANARIDDLQKIYDQWKANLASAKDDKEREALMGQCPINVLSIPNWISAAARVAQVALDSESQALAVNELLHVLADTKQPA
jgi:hypothetical protein